MKPKGDLDRFSSDVAAVNRGIDGMIHDFEQDTSQLLSLLRDAHDHFAGHICGGCHELQERIYDVLPKRRIKSECWYCDGDGVIASGYIDEDGKPQQDGEPCPECDGVRYQLAEDRP